MIIKKDPQELTISFAKWLLQHINAHLKDYPNFHWVLSGGNTPKSLYHLLSTEDYKNKIDWTRIQFYWGDERYLPFNDERNNAHMAFEELLNKVPVNKDHIHVIPTHPDPISAANEYEELLHKTFPGGNQSFDLVLLGIGDNAHTASLFPGYDVILEKKHWVRSYYLEEQMMYRITLTAPVINLAKKVAFLVTGESKARALQNILEQYYNPSLWPAQLIQPHNGKPDWWLDEAAAKNLAKSVIEQSTN
jgi:6-phosphogluconolactonase